jgi:hypothetical protein
LCYYYCTAVKGNVNVWILQFEFKGQWQCPSPLPVKAFVMLPYMYGMYQYSYHCDRAHTWDLLSYAWRSRAHVP